MADVPTPSGFAPRDLARFREIGKIVGFDDRPPEVLTALSISGSAAHREIVARAP